MAKKFDIEIPGADPSGINKLLKKVDITVKIISWLTVFSLLCFAVLRNFFAFDLASSSSLSWLTPVLLAAAVGYLTNYIAIWLLFKPYEPQFGIQGVVPRQKEKLASALGEHIPKYLLKPEEMADQLAKIVREYLQNKQILEEFREKINKFLSKYSKEIAEFLLPFLEQITRQIVRDNLTVENLSRIYDFFLAQWLEDENNSEKLATTICSELQNRSTVFCENIQQNFPELAKKYCRKEHPNLSTFLNIDTLVEHIFASLNWERIKEEIKEKIKEPETVSLVNRELVELTLKLQKYLQSEKAAEELQGLIEEKQKELEIICKEFMVKKIPEIVDKWLKKEEFWQELEKRSMPLLQALFLKRFEQEKMTIVEKFEVPKKIERSVNGLDMEELHYIINKVSGEHLLAIQLLGYLLGAVAGGLLFLAKI